MDKKRQFSFQYICITFLPRYLFSYTKINFCVWFRIASRHITGHAISDNKKLTFSKLMFLPERMQKCSILLDYIQAIQQRYRLSSFPRCPATPLPQTKFHCNCILKNKISINNLYAQPNFFELFFFLRYKVLIISLFIYL